jgi:enoyl-CoA hydratase
MLTLNMTAHHGTKLKERQAMLAALDAAIVLDSTIVLKL